MDRASLELVWRGEGGSVVLWSLDVLLGSCLCSRGRTQMMCIQALQVHS